MKLTLELYDERYTVETINPKQNDFNGDEMKELFSRLLVVAGFGASVLELGEGGRYEYVDNDEIVVKKEYLNELQNRPEN